MDNATPVRMGQRVGHLLPVPQDLVDWQRAVRQARTERLPLDQLHGDEGHRLR